MRTRSNWPLVLLWSSAVCAQYPDTRTYDIRAGQQRPHIQCLAQDAHGLIWAGSNMGVMRTDGERTDMMLRTDGTSVTCLATEGAAVLASLSDGRVMRFRDGRSEQLFADSSLARDPVRAIVPLGGGRLCIGTYGGGIMIRDGSGKAVVAHVKGLPDDHVHAVQPFGEHLLVATDLGLVIVARDGSVLRTIGESDGLPDNLVTALCGADDGSAIVGTDRHGVVTVDLTGRARALTPNWSHGPVRSLAFSDSTVFVSTSKGVVVLALRNGLATYLPPKELQAGRSPLQLLSTKDKSVWWCEDSERLFRADPRVLFTPVHEGLDLTRITALCADRTGRIWIATPDGVFGHFAGFPDREHLMRLPLEVPKHTPVVSLGADRSGKVWAGTFGSGVFRCDPATGVVEHFSTTNGLINDNVLAIAPGEEAWLETWFATLAGLSVHSARSNASAGTFSTPRTLGSGFLYDVAVLPGKGAFAATDGSGLLGIAPDGQPSLYFEAQVNTLYSICSDKEGRLWGTGPTTGLCLLFDGAPELRCFGKDLPPFDGEMYTIEHFADRIVAWGQGGLAAFDPATGKILDLTHEFGLAGARAELNVACTDASGALWLGTDRGLVRLRPSPDVLDPSVPTVITSMRWGAEPIPLSEHISLDHHQNLITVQFAGLRFAAPEHIRFEYRLMGSDTTVRTTRDREVTWSGLLPGHYRFELRAAAGNNAMPSEWTALEFTIKKPWWREWWAVAIASGLMSLLAYLLLKARDNRIRYRDRMAKESARFQLEALRSQVNPHFLFNSFNTLMGLIEEDKDKAVEHTQQLSDFFRNILQVREKDLIPLGDELPLLQTYFSLEHRRFGERVGLELHVPDNQLDLLLPPLTLQLLVENAIKHNVATMEQPLVVKVKAHEGILSVANPYRPRATASPGTGYGLESIRQRYQMLTDRPIQLEVTDSRFEVRIPLLPSRP